LAGKAGFGFDKIKKVILNSGFEKEIITPGYIKEKDLPYLFASADIFIYPSLYEGFGLPVLEAMSVGIPVIASNIPALLEVAQDAVLFVDPKNENQIADAINRLIFNPDLKRELKEKGMIVARQFSWLNCAKKTLEVLEN